MLVWVDNPTNLHRRGFGHLKLSVEHHTTWRPQFQLETEEPGAVLPVIVEPGEWQYRAVHDHTLRPYSFRVDLPVGTGDCFRVGAPK